MQPDSSNTLFQLAADFVNNTSQHIFLTGKAGTGKTTFLKYIKEKTSKNVAIIAPTGVAAINAGGVTMHSFFQLPFGPFIPVSRGSGFGNEITDKHSLFQNIKFAGTKRQLFQEMELLIIDEVSMLRCDMLDAMDTILRHFRRRYNTPFGGVQVLFIGDMFQLPPVVPNNEWDILRQYYNSPFFFDSKVMEEAPPIYIELKKIYRQNEQHFIDLLNKVRNNEVTQEELSMLNNLYNPDFNPAENEKYITLSTHNKRSDAINAAELFKLKGKTYSFEGTITGDFFDTALPTDKVLNLKEGAQVMFIKNDSSTDKRFYNGKLAIIKSINEEDIYVSFEDNSEMKLDKETWENIRYTYNKENGSIDEEELGSFKQFPIRLAWAITIHKSQGLTFTKAIIDAGSSFAPGQVYVALSRCTSLDGIVLLSKIYPQSISTDKRIITFAKRENTTAQLQQSLVTEQHKFQCSELIKLFDWKKTVDIIKEFIELVPGKKLPDTDAAIELSKSLLHKARDQEKIAEKFQAQLNHLLSQLNYNTDTNLLQERISKAIIHFSKIIIEEFIMPLREHLNLLQHASKVKKYLQEVQEIESYIWQQLQKLRQVKFDNIVFDIDNDNIDAFVFSETTVNIKKEKPVKGSSQLESLNLYKSGKTIADIAQLRNLAASTITGHLVEFIKTGEVFIAEFVSEEKIKLIRDVMAQEGDVSSSIIKSKLPEEYSYTDIRAVINHLLWTQNYNPG